MARSFSGTDLINCGSPTVLDNINTGAVFAWVYYTNAATSAVVTRKGATAGTARALQRLSTGRFDFRIGRATTGLVIQAADANCTGAGINKWVCFAAVFDTTGADANQHLYTGDLVTPAAEASAYVTQQVGSGTAGDDSGDDFIIGNQSSGAAPWIGNIGIVQYFNTTQTLGTLRSWQWRPRWLPGTVGLWVPGHDSGTVVPDYSGNLSSGAITGTALAPFFPYVGSVWGNADEERSEGVLGEGAGGMWPDRRRRARAAIYVMRNRRFRF